MDEKRLEMAEAALDRIKRMSETNERSLKAENAIEMLKRVHSLACAATRVEKGNARPIIGYWDFP